MYDVSSMNKLKICTLSIYIEFFWIRFSSYRAIKMHIHILEKEKSRHTGL
jgi:hypothetical protein